MRYQQHGWELKSYEVDGTFCGYASVFETVDMHQEQVVPGAFSKSLKRWEEQQKNPKMLWQHDVAAPIGRWQEVREDHYGLWVKGQILLDLPKGQEAYTLLKAGVVDSLSIGFRVIKASKGEKGYRRLEEVDVMEISLVTFGANPHARVSQCKGILEGGIIVEVIERMKRLRERLAGSLAYPSLIKKEAFYEPRVV